MGYAAVRIQISSWFLFRNSLKRKSFAYVARKACHRHVKRSRTNRNFDIFITNPRNIALSIHTLTHLHQPPSSSTLAGKKALNLESKEHTFSRNSFHFCVFFLFSFRYHYICCYKILNSHLTCHWNIIRIKEYNACIYVKRRKRLARMWQSERVYLKSVCV